MKNLSLFLVMSAKIQLVKEILEIFSYCATVVSLVPTEHGAILHA